MLDLYENIKKRREELGFTQAQLAKSAGYADKTMISKIEKGQIDLPQSKIEVIAKALFTTPAILMGWEKSEEHIDTAVTAAGDAAFFRKYQALPPEKKEIINQLVDQLSK